MTGVRSCFFFNESSRGIGIDETIQFVHRISFFIGGNVSSQWIATMLKLFIAFYGWKGGKQDASQTVGTEWL
jgi:hypothetical protein